MKQLAKMLRLPPPVRRRKNVLKSVRATVAKVCSEPAAQVPPRPSTVGSQSSWTSPIGCWMDTRSGSQCSVTPEAILNNEQLVLPPRISRVNGWSLPLHYFQVVTWAVFVGLSSATFGIFIPLLPHVWKYIAYVVTGGIFSFHLVVHLIASCIDPADSNVRLKKNYSQPMPIFDRSKHAHVIQNQFCHLCRVTVNKKTKHCISCNKCVSGFDHHCKWINNCVGSRNYWFFFSTVASATAGMLCLIAVLLYILVQYLVNPGVLRTDPKYEGWPPRLPVPERVRHPKTSTLNPTLCRSALPGPLPFCITPDFWKCCGFECWQPSVTEDHILEMTPGESCGFPVLFEGSCFRVQRVQGHSVGHEEGMGAGAWQSRQAL
ncbi:probable palmitoyltransferase ZDHHC11B isoform X11 [Pongo abelii]|uniref:probable palmitoyltransferase ZDHHC11B isoform X11 n=1 Tax=Pongo abelii TaxID=9601 RepID=UPI0023E7A6E8|nr:probable palmitoyltransferase ZDHHC11B isoform X11 [Pongo abelii]